MLVIILCIVIVSFFINYRKSMLLIAPLNAFCAQTMIIGQFSFKSILVFVSTLFFVINYRKVFSKNDSFPLLLPFIFMILSRSIGVFMGVFHFNSLFSVLMDNYVFCFLLYYCIKDKNDVSLLVWSIFAFILIMLLNSFVEYASGQSINPLSSFVKSNSSQRIFFSEDDYSRGIRIRSGYPHSIVYGDICSLFMYFFYCCYFRIKKSFLFLGIFVLLVLGVYLSASRTPILGVLVFSIPVILNKKNISGRGFLIFTLLIIGASFFYEYIFTALDSMFNSNSKTEVGGSSMDLRMQQFEACFMIISDNLYFGLGSEFNLERWSYVLAGCESVWFELLCRQGIVGCVIYASIYIFMFLKSVRNSLFKEIFFLGLGWLIMSTASNLTGMDIYPLILAFIILYKNGVFLKAADNSKNQLLIN